MENFTYHNPVTIVFGRGSLAELVNLIPLDTKTLITYGGGSVKRSGVHDQVREALLGRPLLEFEGIEPNPRYETLMKAVELGRKETVDFLLAVDVRRRPQPLSLYTFFFWPLELPAAAKQSGHQRGFIPKRSLARDCHHPDVLRFPRVRLNSGRGFPTLVLKMV